MAATLAIYVQSAGFEFIRLDDEVCALSPLARQGFTLDSLRWMVSESDSNWLPLTRLSYILDNLIFGLNSGESHVVNFLIHMAASVMAFWFLLRATGNRWQSAFVSMLFAVHPLHVESVAWSAERKDVLCALFWFWSLWAWVGYTRDPTRKHYRNSLILFCLGLMSKPMMVTMPVVMVLLDLWPLGRGISKATLKEKLPFFWLSAGSALVTFVAQKLGGAVQSFGTYGVAIRIENALVTWVIYVVSTVWPVKLAIMYPHPESIPVWQAAGCGALLCLVCAAAIGVRKRLPYLTTGWFWYLISTLPVIGLIQVGSQARADRYMYIPMAGLGIMAAWSAGDLVRRRQSLRIPTAALATAALAALGVCAWVQTSYWRNSELVFTHAIAVTENNFLAYQNLGSALTQWPDRQAEALACFEKAVKIQPWRALAHSSLCGALQSAGRVEEAERECAAAIRLDPSYWEGHNNMAAVYAALGRPEDAIAEFRAAAKANPFGAAAFANLGVMLFSRGRMQEALAADESAIALDANKPAPHYNKGVVLLETGDTRGARDEFEEALRLNPNYAEAHAMLGTALTRLPGGSLDSFEEFGAALRLNPNLALAHGNLAVALSDAGRDRDAVEQIRAAVLLEPGPKWAAKRDEIEAKAAKAK